MNRKEQQDIAEAINGSKKEFETQTELDLCKTLEDLKKVGMNEPWKKVDDDDNFTACTLSASEGPCIEPLT